MPSFDRIAQAAMTPGGAQAGVNDIVAAILNADAQKAKAAQEAQGQALDQQRLGETIRSNMANEGLKGRDMAGDSAYRDKSLGETIRHNMADESLGHRQYMGDPTLAQDRQFDLDWKTANTNTGLDPSGQTWVPQTSYDPLDIGHANPIIKQVKGPPAPDVESRRQEEFKKLRAARAQGTGSVVAGAMDPKTATAPVSAGAPATPAPLGPPANARQPLDYEALDAKFQAQSPTYRQKRSDPSFDWKKFLDARAPR